MKKQIEALSLFSAGKCNLNCSYCYIPKLKSSKTLHEKVIEEFPSDIDKSFSNVKHFSLWGTEPTISLPDISNKIYNIIAKNPKLESLTFSSNFTNIKPILTFLKNIFKDRKFTVRIQVSMDGSTDVTNLNRGKNIGKLIEDNILSLVCGLNEIDLGNISVDISNKSTWNSENLKYFLEDEERIYDNYMYLDSITGKTKDLLKNKKVFITLNGYANMEHPGKFTSEDGKCLRDVLIKMNKIIEEDEKNKIFKHIKPKLMYQDGIQRIFDYSEEILHKFSMFTCSGGRSQVGVGLNNSFHICHRDFVYTDKDYFQELKNNLSSHFDGIVLERGGIDLVLSKYSGNINNEKDLSRFLYVMAGYHNYLGIKRSIGTTLINELATCKQIYKKYLDPKDSFLLMLCSNILVSCPIEYVLATGSIQVLPVATYRLLGNGALEVIVNRVSRQRKYTAAK